MYLVVAVSDMAYNRFSHNTRIMDSFLQMHLIQRTHMHLMCRKLIVYLISQIWLIWSLTQRSVEFAYLVHIHRCKCSKSDEYCLVFVHPTIGQCLDIDNIPNRNTANWPKTYPIDRYKSSSMVDYVRRSMMFDRIYHLVRRMLAMHRYELRRRIHYFDNRRNVHGIRNTMVL